ncbi:hypothetical protein [Sphingobium cupriresistens]|uniref:hypothetical protein n=1 Tax=Sphingobium cupriresistens TaxID=1132417 RepID=UPI003BADDF27
MARPPKDGTTTPREMAEVEPHELFPTNNIRHVITETAKLVERVDNLSRSVEKIPGEIASQVDKLAASLEKQNAALVASIEKTGEKITTDLRERIDEVKLETKGTKDKVTDLEKDMSFYKKIMAIMGAVFLLLVAAVFKFALDKM